MGRPFFLVENLFSTVQFAGHVLTASEAATGGEVWRVASGRRSPRDRWASVTPNAPAWLRVACGVGRTADVLVLDRGHNLAGHRVLLEASNDGFATTTTVLDVVLPAAPAVNGSADAAEGAHTDEGAWIRRFPQVTASSWRVSIPAMGAGLVPSVVGLWLGRSWTPMQYFDLPWGDDTVDLRYQPASTDAGWMATGRTARPRTGTIGLKLQSVAEYELARYHIRDHFWRPRPMWIVYDSDRAERAVLAMAPPGRYGFEQEEGWHPRQARIEWVEHQPRPE